MYSKQEENSINMDNNIMSNCVCKFVSGVWGFIVGSLRVILFILCMLLFILTIVSFYKCYSILDDIDKSGIEELSPIRLAIIYFTLALVVLSLIGMHGAYRKDTKYLKWVSFRDQLSRIILSHLSRQPLTTQ